MYRTPKYYEDATAEISLLARFLSEDAEQIEIQQMQLLIEERRPVDSGFCENPRTRTGSFARSVGETQGKKSNILLFSVQKTFVYFEISVLPSPDVNQVGDIFSPLHNNYSTSGYGEC